METKPRFSLRLLPLSLALIVFATGIPIEWRPAAGLDLRLDVVDVVQNLLLYMPLGIALHTRKLPTVAFIAFVLSLAAETLQLWTFERFASPWDLAANVLGACAGACAWRRWRGDKGSLVSIPVDLRLIFVAVVLSLGILAIWRWPTASASLAHWDPEYPLLIGNETTGDRPWKGTVVQLSIFSDALSATEIRSLERIADLSTVPGRKPLYQSSEALALEGGTPVVLPGAAARAVFAGATSKGAFTVAARVMTSNIEQGGPARIITFSLGTQHRNFDLGQEGRTLVFRVRTPISTDNGSDYYAQTTAVLEAGQQALVVATYDGAISRIFVNGYPYARSDLAGAACIVTAPCVSSVGLAWSVLGATLALITLASLGRSSRLRAAVAAVLLVSLMLALLRMGAVPEWALKPFWMPLMMFAGAAITCFAASAPRRSGG